jgi:kumamolisin
VSAVADDVTGWDIFADGFWSPAGGTSAAVPLWVGLTALADQALARHGLAPVGFASPLLYGFAQSPGKLPAPAFNDVTRGENLYYPAGPGWDFATGLGTPNAAGIVDDFVQYRETHR